MPAGRVRTKQCDRLDRWQGRWALAPGEAGAMRRVQAPIRGARSQESIISERLPAGEAVVEAVPVPDLVLAEPPAEEDGAAVA